MATKSKNVSAGKTPAKKSAAKELEDLFEDSLKDIYWAEKALTKALPKMQKNATNKNLIDAIGSHLEETKNQIDRLEKVFEIIGEKAVAKKCDAMDGLIKEGKIKHIGVSNEAPWAVMKFISESEKHNLPRIATIQNPYSLLNRLFEVGLTEVCMRENIGLMAYSPLGFGILSGKHLNGTLPNSRIALFPQFTRYTSENATKATKLYQELANNHGLTLSQMALAFVQQQTFVMSTIIGATSLNQLKENIGAHEIVLSKEILNEIDTIQEMIPNPAP